jgi:Ca-activated chloride channel family protein
MVYALDRTVYQDFAGMDNVTPKKIILITDGGENCGGDPCAFARELMTKRSDIHIDVVLVSSNSRQLTCLTSTTGGHFYNINNLSDFSTTINRSIKSKPTEVLNNSAESQNNGQGYEFINIEE